MLLNARKKKNRVKYNPGLSANRPLNNWALAVRPGWPLLIFKRNILSAAGLTQLLVTGQLSVNMKAILFH